MRLKLSGNGRHLVRYAALIAAGTFLAGCSSGVSRFQDGIFTGSTANQRSIIGAPANQPYPGDVGRNAAPADNVYTGSVNRAAVTPVPVNSQPMQRASLPAVTSSPLPEPTRTASAQPAPVAPPPVAPSPTRGAPPSILGTLPANSAPVVAQAPASQAAAPRPVAAAPAAGGEVQEGWSRTGGTEVTVRSGETIYNLSRRFGVPADAIMKANGMGSAGQLAVGQQIVIPTYVYSRRAPVSAPDANPNVADARSSTGTRHDVPADRVPVPAPAQRVAVLPSVPKPTESSTGEQQTATAPVAPAPSAPAVQPLPQPAVVKNTEPGGGYTVVAGDSLYAIARKTGTTTERLKAANGLSDGVLRIGQKLVIPAAGQVTVAAAPAKVDSVTTGTARPKAEPQTEPSPVTAYTPPRVAEKVIREAEESAAVAPGATGVARMRWPARGRIISSYGRSGGRTNDGIDIAVPEGTSVKAAENGVVIYAGDGLKEFGNTVLVRHEDGLVTVYGHASELKVTRGEKVRRGQEIARSGMSGSADTPKLHFEVRKDSTPVDPTQFLE